MNTSLRIFKFGGASVKDAAAARNVVSILQRFKNERLLVVVSAMGKTTNLLEQLVAAYVNKDKSLQDIFGQVKTFHLALLHALFPDTKHAIYAEVNNLFVEIDWVLEEEPGRDYDFIYDQLVSVGELLSTKIVAALINAGGLQCQWLDARDMIATDNRYREARIDWQQTEQHTRECLSKHPTHKLFITQGFIGSTSENFTTTLGREGSDYTAAILAYCLDAKDVVIWKDVPGVLNADPKYFPDAQLLEQVSYQDAIELAYFGASVIHPKTIQPLQNKGIPLHVRSFVQTDAEGTLIGPDSRTNTSIPSYIFKTEQTLLSISARDFSFIAEDHLSSIFACFVKHRVRMNLMQNSAISFSVCTDGDTLKIEALVADLRERFHVRYNEHLTLLTIRHYNAETMARLSEGKSVLLEQRSRHTVQLVMQKIHFISPGR